MMKVCKFGGSSLANANQFRKIKDIVVRDATRQVVVVSALGKAVFSDHKITDLLYLCHAHLQYGVAFDPIFADIENRYEAVRNDLGLNLDIRNLFAQLKGKLNKDTEVDALVSKGETFSAMLLAEFLGYTFVDAKDVICLNYDGSVNTEKTYDAIEAVYAQHRRIVIPGFYGALPNGKIKVLPRGGSDITGAICAAALNAEVYENWTDVSGILMADPRIVQHAKSIQQLTFAELREMAFMGASVLHEESIQPVKVKAIPLNIRNTNVPDHPGTMIVNEIQDEADPDRFITGITGLQDFTVISIIKELIAKDPSVFRQILEIFEDNDITIELLTKGIDSFTLTVKTQAIKDRQYDILTEIQKQVHPDRINVEDQLALIAVVGRKMKMKPGISGQLFSALGAKKINIRLIAQGTDEISIIVGVDNRDFTHCIEVLYDSFIGS